MHILSATASRSGLIMADGGQVLTAAELRHGAASLAGYLGSRGLRAGDRVVLSGPRGPETLVALYACWYGGFVAAPLEAGLPPDRIRGIFAECAPSAALAVGSRASQLLRRAGPVDVFVTTHPQEGEERWSTALVAPPRPAAGLSDDAVASLHFTSGSTGEAKGVPYTRGGIDVFIDFWSKTLDLGRSDRVVWAFPMAYAPSLIPLGAALAAGATVVPLAAAAASVGDLSRAALSSATVLLGVPALVASLLDRGDLNGSGLRAIVLAGEPVPAALARRLRGALPDARLINLYGTTECNGVATFEVTGPVDGSHLPAGRPLPFMSVRIVDDEGAEAPEGEVVVAGPTVMSGYWGDTHRASWRLIDGQRHYCTGDRGRCGPDGLLHLLGRGDGQLKIGGHRVELGAVEAACADVPGVDESAAVAVGPADAREVRLFVAGDVAVDDVAACLRRTLPAYAQPARIDRLEALPRGPRGKVDRGALRRLAEPSVGGVAS